jgi:hypothetical protein
MYGLGLPLPCSLYVERHAATFQRILGMKKQGYQVTETREV